MTKKTTTPTRKFIAIDDYEGMVIGMGTYKEVKDAVEEFVNDNEISEDEIDNYIEIYELGSKKTTNANSKGIDIEFY